MLVLLLGTGIITRLLSLEVVGKRAFFEIDGLELAVGIKAEHHTEGVVDEAYDWNDVCKLLCSRKAVQVLSILQGSQEEHHVNQTEKNAQEDEYHEGDVAEGALADEQQQQH